MGRHKRNHQQYNDGRDSRTDGDSLSTQGSHTMISGRSIEVNCFGSMSYGGTKRSESNASRRSLDMDTLDMGDDRDESKRKSRNLSEKKRRDQFNVLINELSSMVSNSPRKMDKSTVLKATIAFLKAHNELTVQSQVQETQEDWKPSFLSNEEFTHLMLESLDGFIIVLSSTGKVLYLSESITSLLGHLSSDLLNGSLYDYIALEEHSDVHNILSNPTEDKGRNSVSMILNFKLGGFGISEESQKYQLVKIVGYFKRWISTECGGSESNTEKSEGEFSESNDSSATNYVFIATGRLIDSDLLREMSVVVDTAKNEFTSRHSLEWKFLFLDHRAPPIIGYLPFEVLGTSGYDYYHAEDLEKVAISHEALMQKGEGTSCFYRFLTKGQQWIWLQTRFYITYHQWNSKPEFIVCTHRVVSYADVMKEIRGETISHSPRLGPSLPKQPKLEKKSNNGFPSVNKTSKQKNGNMCYGSVGSKRTNFMRKLDLPPKFVSALSTSHSVLLQPQKHYALEVPQSVPFSESTLSPSCPQTFNNSTVTVALHPQMSQFAQPQLAVAAPSQHLQPTVAVPIAAFHSTPLPQNTTFAVSTSSGLQNTGNHGTVSLPQGAQLVPTSQCILQEQLMMKHAELQRQIIQQQEELRRVSEQLLMAQCGFIPADASIIIPQTIQPPTSHHSTEDTSSNAVHLQQVQ